MFGTHLHVLEDLGHYHMSARNAYGTLSVPIHALLPHNRNRDMIDNKGQHKVLVLHRNQSSRRSVYYRSQSGLQGGDRDTQVQGLHQVQA